MLFKTNSFKQYYQFKDLAVLVFIIKDQQILLINKLRGLGKGKINGPGGKVEPHESFEQAAIRETLEEVHLSVTNLQESAKLGFFFKDGYSLYVRVFITTNFTGTAQASPEAIPFWQEIQTIPYDAMWQDDVLWLPEILAGNFVEGLFWFQEDNMLSHQISINP